MKPQSKSSKILAITTIMLITAVMLSTTIYPAKAQLTNIGAPTLPAWQTSVPSGVTPNITISTSSYMSISPDPIGIGQTILVNLWLEPPMQYNRYVSGFSVTITKPDGTKDTIGPMNSYQGDATAWFQYTADQVGTWKFKFDFAGNYFPAGIYFNGRVYPNVSAIGPYTATSFGAPIQLESAYYQPSSSPEQTLTVQSEPVLPWPAAQLPTDYWTRPIPIGYREWWVIGGQYPFAGQGGGPEWPANTNTFASNYKFTPYVQGPNSAHIAWKRQGALAGISGGQYGYRSNGPGEGTYAGTPNIIFQGRAYQSINKPMPITINGSTVVETTSTWTCYDIRTGKVYWEQTGISQPPTVVTYNQVAASVPGAAETGQGQGSYSLMYIGSRLIKYDPWSGAVTLNISLPVTSGTYYKEPFVLSVQNLGSSKYALINWTTTGTDANFTNRIMSNVSYPFSSLGVCDYESMVAVSTGSIIPPGAGTAQGQFIMGASLVSGNLLWNVTTNDIFYSSSTGVADHGKYTVRMLGGWWDCWDLASGKQVWKSETLAYPWGDFGAYTIASYGGLFYDFSYAGIYAIDWNTGKVAWRFIAPATPFEAPWYPTASWFSNSPIIADGKLYYGNGEHSPTEPLARDWHFWCLNATTGQQIWNITGGGAAGAVSDGYITYDNRYDGYMYVFGKGQSATKVSAPQTAIATGQKVIISGTVLDQSPAQPGAACVSKDSMKTYMEYLHMQYPIDGLYHNATVTGVPVSIDAIDPNGNYVHIGDTTSDSSGTFGFTWAPTIAGQYKITASFAGDDSYGSSWGQTYAAVVEAPATVSPTATPISFDAINNTITTTILGAAVAIIVAVALATVLILRKKP
jgi:outer membrane protein assembly factor BamB